MKNNCVLENQEHEIYKKIGFFFPDTNEKSEFQARELKSLHLDYQCHKIKLILHRNHQNMNNIFKQIGIVGLNVYGVEIISIKELNENLKIKENPNTQVILEIKKEKSISHKSLIKESGISSQIKFNKIDNLNLIKNESNKGRNNYDRNKISPDKSKQGFINNINNNFINKSENNIINNIEYNRNQNKNNFDINKSNFNSNIKKINYNGNLDRNLTSNYNSIYNDSYHQTTFNSGKSAYTKNINKKEDSIFKDKIDYLNSQKEKAINDENYDKAKLICDFVRKLRDLSDKINYLEKEKKFAVEIEDFEKAKIIKNEIEILKNSADFNREDYLLFKEKKLKKSNQISTERTIKSNFNSYFNMSKINIKKIFHINHSLEDLNENQENLFINPVYVNQEDNKSKRIISSQYNKNYNKIHNLRNFNQVLNPNIGKYKSPYGIDKRILNKINKFNYSAEEDNLQNLYHSVEVNPSKNKNNVSLKEKQIGKILSKVSIKEDRNNKYDKIKTTRNKIDEIGKLKIEELNNSTENIKNEHLLDLSSTEKNSPDRRKPSNKQLKDIFGSRDDKFENLINSAVLNRKKNINNNLFNLDRDERIIRGINKDFNQFVLEKLEDNNMNIPKEEKQEEENIYRKIKKDNLNLDTEKNKIMDSLSKSNKRKDKILNKNNNNKNNYKTIVENNNFILKNLNINKGNNDKEKEVSNSKDKSNYFLRKSNEKKSHKQTSDNRANENNLLLFKNTNQLKKDIANILKNAENLNKSKDESKRDFSTIEKASRKMSEKSPKATKPNIITNKNNKNIDLPISSERVSTEENIYMNIKDENFPVNANLNNQNQNQFHIKQFINTDKDTNIISNENLIADEENENNEVILNDAKPLYDFLSYNLIKMLFSKNWKIREKALKLIDAEISNFPNLHSNNSVFGTNSIKEIYFAVVYSVVYILSSNILPLFVFSLNLFKNTLNKFNKDKELFQLVQKKKNEFNSITIKAIELIIEKVGDLNPKIKEITDSCLLELSISSLIGEKFLLDILINENTKNSKGKNVKFILSKINIVNKIINLHGIFKYSKSSLLENIIEYTIISHNNINKEIREEAINTIFSIYYLIENKEDFINKYFKNKDSKLFNSLMQRISFNINNQFEKEYIDMKINSFIKINNIKNNNNNDIKNNYSNNSSTNKILDSKNKFLKSGNEKNYSNNIKISKNEINNSNNNQSVSIDSSMIKNRPFSTKSENRRINNKCDISNIDNNINESIKIIINNNNFNYNYKKKESNKLHPDLKFNETIDDKNSTENKSNNVFNKLRTNAKLNKLNDFKEILNLNNSIDKIRIKNNEERIPLFDNKITKSHYYNTIDKNNELPIKRPVYFKLQNEKTKLDEEIKEIETKKIIELIKNEDTNNKGKLNYFYNFKKN